MRKKGRGTTRIIASLPFVVSLRTEQSVYESATGQTSVMTVVVDRFGNMGYPGSVGWSVAPIGTNPATQADFGGDYPSDTVAFGPNDLTASFDITIHGNDTIDGDRTFQLSLGGAQTTGGSGIATIGIGSIICTILDDDTAGATSDVHYGGEPAYYGGNPCSYGD